jgi:hypothetical protein
MKRTRLLAMGILGAGFLLAPAVARAASAPAVEPAAVASKPWYDPAKDIELGPGKLDIGLNVRSRYEYQDNFNVLHYGTGTHDDVLLMRSRLSFDYKLPDEAHVFVEFQDARYWLSRLERGDFSGPCSYQDDFDLRQAYLEWKHIGGSPWGVKLGRQILLYADGRVFAPAEWGNVGNYWWDAAKLYFDTDALQVDAFYAERVISDPLRWNDEHYPYHIGALYAQIKQLPVKLDAFYVVKYDDAGATKGESGTDDEARHTVGVYSARPEGKGWDYTFVAAGQFGQYGRDDLRAVGLVARGGYTFDAPWSPRLGVEMDYASGDSDPQDGVTETFDSIFGKNDIPYGWMNVVSLRNLEDYSVTFSVQPANPLKLMAEFHCFRLANDRDAWYWVSGKAERRDRTGAAGGDLGQELDLIARWQVNKEMELLVGYAHFWPGGFIHNTGGNHSALNWAFAQLTYAF